MRRSGYAPRRAPVLTRATDISIDEHPNYNKALTDILEGNEQNSVLKS